MNILKRNSLSSEFNAKAEGTEAPLNELMTWLIFENGTEEASDESKKNSEEEAKTRPD